jgi:hypothetical protein
VRFFQIVVFVIVNSRLSEDVLSMFVSDVQLHMHVFIPFVYDSLD